MPRAHDGKNAKCLTLLIFCFGMPWFWSNSARSDGMYDWPIVSNTAWLALTVATVLLSMP